MRMSIRGVIASAFFAFVSLSVATAQEAEAEYSRAGADTCLGCHDDVKVTSIFLNKHGHPGDPNSPFGEGQLQCEACHGPGGEHAKLSRRGESKPSVPYWGHASTADTAEHNQVCLGCHQKHMGLQWAGSTHDVEDLNCSGCHNPHAQADPVLKTYTQSQVCYECHAAQKADENKPYAHPIAERRMACTSCHAPHGSSADHLLVRNTTNETCYTCHQEKRGPLLWEHASGHPSLPYTSTGLADGNPSAYLLGGSCLNCHSQVHGSNHPSGATLSR
jgi:DmsE family decaheme c-type cytochrome